MILSGGRVLGGFLPESLGDTTPMFADASYYPTSTLELTGTFAAYGEMYRAQLWVYILVRKLSVATARIPLDVKRAGTGTNQTPEAGPLTDLLGRPNDRTTGFGLWRWVSATSDIYGEAFLLKLRGKDGVVRELQPIHPTQLVVRTHPDTGEIFYHYTAGVRNSSPLPPIPEADMVPFVSYNPDNQRRGLSALEPLRQTLLNEDSSRRATASFWQRGARPSVALRHPGELSAAAQARLRATWEAQHAGADLMGGTAILEEGMEAQVISLSAEEMQYIQSRKLNREEVCAAYDVPPPVVHILDHATFSNITEQMRSMYRDTMAPRFQAIEAVLNHHLVPDFYPDRDVFVRFNMDETIRGDFEVRADAAQKLVQSGILKPSEARPMFGLATAGPEADQLYGNAALVPLGTSVHGQQEVGPAGDLIPSPLDTGLPKPKLPAPPAPPAAGRAFPARRFARAVGAVKAAGGDVRQHLVDAHVEALTPVFASQRASAKTQTKDALGEGWDGELAALLADLGAATAKAIGAAVGKQLGGGYDVGEIADWIRENAVTSAAAINAATVEELRAALDAADDPAAAVDAVFDGPVAGRLEAIAASRVAMVGGLASLNAAGQNGAATKTWVTGRNARPGHASMNGETVPLGEPFSNGMNAPGDPAGGADEVAGCNCDLSYNQ